MHCLERAYRATFAAEITPHLPDVVIRRVRVRDLGNGRINFRATFAGPPEQLAQLQQAAAVAVGQQQQG